VRALNNDAIDPAEIRDARPNPTDLRALVAGHATLTIICLGLLGYVVYSLLDYLNNLDEVQDVVFPPEIAAAGAGLILMTGVFVNLLQCWKIQSQRDGTKSGLKVQPGAAVAFSAQLVGCTLPLIVLGPAGIGAILIALFIACVTSAKPLHGMWLGRKA
jgi:hypothetical protein